MLFLIRYSIPLLIFLYRIFYLTNSPFYRTYLYFYFRFFQLRNSYFYHILCSNPHFYRTFFTFAFLFIFIALLSHFTFAFFFLIRICIARFYSHFYRLSHLLIFQFAFFSFIAIFVCFPFPNFSNFHFYRTFDFLTSYNIAFPYFLFCIIAPSNFALFVYYCYLLRIITYTIAYRETYTRMNIDHSTHITYTITYAHTRINIDHRHTYTHEPLHK